MQDLHEDAEGPEFGPGGNVRRFSARRALARGTQRARELSATAGTLVDSPEKRHAAYAAAGLVFALGFLSGVLLARSRD